MGMSSQTLYCLTFLISVQHLLPCGYCHDKTESSHHISAGLALHQEGKDGASWNSWEPTLSKVHDWTSLTSQPQTVPFSIEEQSKRQQKQKSTNKKTSNAKKPANKSFDIGIDEIRRVILKYGKSILDFVTGKGAIMGLRTFFPDSPSSSTSRQFGTPSVVDWLARLIGVEGKSLGEFLREYQVHVLYDLVFTFFKWVFFLYAGLLIP